jgi:hypothetical protein
VAVNFPVLATVLLMEAKFASKVVHRVVVRIQGHGLPHNIANDGLPPFMSSSWYDSNRPSQVSPGRSILSLFRNLLQHVGFWTKAFLRSKPVGTGSFECF